MPLENPTTVCPDFGCLGKPEHMLNDRASQETSNPFKIQTLKTSDVYYTEEGSDGLKYDFGDQQQLCISLFEIIFFTVLTSFPIKIKKDVKPSNNV